MQVSSESDFELFAKKVKAHTLTAVKKIEDEASLYVAESEKKALEDIERYSQEIRIQWEKEFRQKEQQEYKNIESDLKREWNSFKQDRESMLYKYVQEGIEKIFSSLVESFLAYISDHYESGILIMPNSFAQKVNIEKFEVHESEDERIIFKKDNLYIEYSLERVMEELHNDIASSMSFEENLWQV